MLIQEKNHKRWLHQLHNDAGPGFIPCVGRALGCTTPALDVPPLLSLLSTQWSTLTHEKTPELNYRSPKEEFFTF